MNDKPPTLLEWLKTQERFAKWQLRYARKQIAEALLGPSVADLTPDQVEVLMDDLHDDEFFFEKYLALIKSQREHIHERYPTDPFRGASRRG